MRFRHVNSYAATPADVYAMLTSPAFRDQVCLHQEALEHAVDVTATPEGTTVVITQTQSMTAAPSVARKVVGDSVQIVQREAWREAAGAPSADFAMEIPGKPGHLRGRVELVPTGGGCDEVFTGEVKVSVPLLGGKLEGLVADILVRALRREGRVGVTWLGGSPEPPGRSD